MRYKMYIFCKLFYANVHINIPICPAHCEAFILLCNFHHISHSSRSSDELFSLLGRFVNFTLLPLKSSYPKIFDWATSPIIRYFCLGPTILGNPLSGFTSWRNSLRWRYLGDNRCDRNHQQINS